MITGVHALLYSRRADAVRAFFKDVLGWPGVDAGEGWLIFACPPAEVAMHPSEKPATELYLMCDDIQATVAELESRGTTISKPVTDQGWGLVTAIRLPDGEEMGIYQPRHPVAITSERRTKTRTKPRTKKRTKPPSRKR